MKSQLDIFRSKLGNNSYLPNAYEEEIFHYTSPEGFSSILFGDVNCVTLWASRFDCLNDISEGKIVQEVFQEVCRELLTSNAIKDDLYKVITTTALNRTKIFHVLQGEKEKIIRPEFDRFICSFSKSKDSLPMWNYYSKGGGYEGFNIGFSPDKIRNSLANFMKNRIANCDVIPIIYDKEAQKNYIKSFVLRMSNLSPSEYGFCMRYCIAEALGDWQLVFKDPHFIHEDEVRIIIDIPKVQDQLSVKYRINKGYVIPYVEIKLNKDVVSSVNFGPLENTDDHKKQQKKVMEKMLKEKGYSPNVGFSQIPVRY